VSTQTEVAGRPDIPPGEFLGHPKALWQLSNIEMWERFAYYGMRALLAVYVATTFFGHMGDQANAEASLVYGGYTALVYATGIIGGYIADHVLGYQRSILLGAIIMAAGLFVLLIEDLHWFLVGLALIVAGNGLFKPNISTMIGKLYAAGDIRRDSGFTSSHRSLPRRGSAPPGASSGAFSPRRWAWCFRPCSWRSPRSRSATSVCRPRGKTAGAGSSRLGWVRWCPRWAFISCSPRVKSWATCWSAS
jgi:POT family proton-dependent oligopeptide transporter